MFKPYIIIYTSHDEILNAKIYFSKNKPVPVDLVKLANIINFKEDIAIKKIKPGVYKIDDERVTRRFLSKKVNRTKNNLVRCTFKVALSVIVALSIKHGVDSLGNEKEVIFERPTFGQENLLSIEKSNPGNISYFIPDSTLSDFKKVFETEIPPEKTFAFNYDDRTNSKKHQIAISEYSMIAKKYAEMYGLDYNLILAMITQENVYNVINESVLNNKPLIGANGIMQVESIWHDEKVSAYNFEQNEYETLTIDFFKLSDPDYATKTGCMILRNYFDTIYNNYVTNNVLNESEAILASLVAYNKGITAICRLINSYGNDYINHIDETRGGDNLYLEHVLSYVEDNSKISVLSPDKKACMVFLDNTINNNFVK